MSEIGAIEWAEIRAKILDRSQWWELRKILGLSFFDGDELYSAGVCTGYTPDTLESAYVVHNAGQEFWQYQMSVSIVEFVSSRLRLCYGVGSCEAAMLPELPIDQRCKDLRGADLCYADLSKAFLVHTDLKGADLRYANLRGADLFGADLGDAVLVRANLRGAGMIGAYLAGADLRGADLFGADLRDAILTGADLRGADLRHAKLRCPDLRGIDLTGAKYNQNTLRPPMFFLETSVMEFAE